MLGLADDDHTQYLNLAKASQELKESLAVTDSKTIDGRDISVDGADLDTHKAGTAAAQHAAGLGLGSLLGAWETKADNTVYQAATDGFVLCRGTTDIAVVGYTDGSNPPTTERIRQASSQNSINSFTMPVRKNDYWKVTGGSVIYWIPLGW